MPIFHVPTSLKFNRCGNNCQNEKSAETRCGLSLLFLAFLLNAAQKRSDFHTKSFAHDKEGMEKETCLCAGGNASFCAIVLQTWGFDFHKQIARKRIKLEKKTKIYIYINGFIYI